MPLDPHVKRFLRMLAAGGIPEVSELTPAKMRRAILRLAQAVDVKDIPIGKRENRELPGLSGPLRVRIYIPASIKTGKSAGLVYFHGGAGVFCNIETHEGLCRMLANESGCRVISVDYRLAPEHKFPAAVEDSYFATKWVSEHALELDIDPDRIAIGGDSAGGTLAAVVCQLAKQTGGPSLALQVLFCPVTDVSADTDVTQGLCRTLLFRQDNHGMGPQTLLSAWDRFRGPAHFSASRLRSCRPSARAYPYG